MNRSKAEKSDAYRSQLRRKAEEKLKNIEKELATISDQHVQEIVHELSVHQIELEMQNEELRRAQTELEESRSKYFDLYNFAPVSYFTFDKKGIIIEVNLTGAGQLGIERQYLISRPFTSFVASQSKLFYKHLKEVFETGVKQTCEIKLRKIDRTSFHARMESIAVQDPDGNYTSCRSAVIDLTEKKMAEQALRESESKYHSLFANMTNGFAYHQIIVDGNGRPIDCIFLDINDAFEKITGLKREHLIGRRVTEVLPGLEKDDVDWIGEFGKVALTGKGIRFETYGRLRNRWYSVSAFSPLKGYFGAIFQDITELRILLIDR